MQCQVADGPFAGFAHAQVNFDVRSVEVRVCDGTKDCILPEYLCGVGEVIVAVVAVVAPRSSLSVSSSWRAKLLEPLPPPGSARKCSHPLLGGSGGVQAPRERREEDHGPRDESCCVAASKQDKPQNEEKEDCTGLSMLPTRFCRSRLSPRLL